MRSSVTRPILPLSILILGTAFFVIFVPIVPVSQSCVSPGCGGPEYESLSYVMIGIGETISFVSPNPPYTLIAMGVSLVFLVAIVYGIFTVSQRFRRRKEPTDPN